MAASFWGLKLSKGLQFTKVAEKSFHISSATLDPSSTTAEDVLSVIFEEDDQEFILCNLSLKYGVLQVPLDLQFSEGDNITFSLRGGKGNVFLTGYNIFDEDFGDLVESDEGGEEEECDEEEEVLSIPSPVNAKRKREAIEESQSKSPKKQVKRSKMENDQKAKKDSESGGSPSLKVKKKNKAQAAPNKSPSDARNQKSEGSKSARKNADAKKSEAGVRKLEPVSKSLSALMANGDIEEDEDDDDFLVGEEEEDASDEEMEEAGEEEEEDDDDEEEEENEDDSEEEMEAESTGKGSSPIVHSPGKTPIVKGNQQKKNKGNLNQSQSKTPQRDQSVETPQSKKKKKKDKENLSTPKGAEDKTPKKKEMKTPGSEKKQDPQQQSPSAGRKEVKSGGVVVEEIVVGSGTVAKHGRMVSAYYEGKLKNGKTFDKTLTGPPFKFRLGLNEVIKGWDVGIIGMKVGGKRKITVPPNMGYGKQGAPPAIPPNSLLIFNVELKGVN